jgi:outer membrane protein assembly factor BamB
MMHGATRRMAAAFSALALAALLLGGCGAPDRAAQQSAAPAAAAPTVAPPAAIAGDRLYIRDGDEGDRQRLTILDGAAGMPQHSLPLGVASPDWSALYAAQTSSSAGRNTTKLQAIDVKTGQPIRETTIDGSYALPRVGLDGTLGGLSPDGRWIVLQAEPAREQGRLRSRLVVLDTAFAKPPRSVDLEGDFWFDAIGNSGDRLYLLEYTSAESREKYQVRAYNLGAGMLDPQVVVAKGESAIMRGTRLASIPSLGGDWLYSLYMSQGNGPFIHVLNLDEQFAICIDLPKTGQEDIDKQMLWSLALNKGKTRLYAVNGALNLVTEMVVNGGVPEVQRTATLPAPTAGVGPSGIAALFAAPVAEAKRSLSGGAVLSPDGKTLFAIGEQGLLAIDTKDLSLRDRYLPGWRLDSIALSADGARLYAVSAEQGKIVRIDPASGAPVAEVAGASRPSGLLRVEAQPAVTR